MTVSSHFVSKGPLRIAMVHSFYRSANPSGENIAVLRLTEALRRAGHQVLLLERHSDDLHARPFGALRSAARVGSGYGYDPSSTLLAFAPDIVHVHNLFPTFGDRWLQRWRGPVVATLHNYRAMCANALLFRNGQPCTHCIRGTAMNSLIHACYRDSRLATLPLTLATAGGPARSRLLQRADRIITLSKRSKDLLTSWGGPELASKVRVVPNGVPDQRVGPVGSPHQWTFVGRLTREKGAEELLGSWPEGESLTVIGDGPQLEQLRLRAGSGICFTGQLDNQEVHKHLAASWGLVFPSRWFETGGPPLVVAEALMHGTPIVAKAGSAGADFVKDHSVGVLYDENVLGALTLARSGGDQLRRRARQTFQELLDETVHITAIVRLYRELCS